MSYSEKDTPEVNISEMEIYDIARKGGLQMFYHYGDFHVKDSQHARDVLREAVLAGARFNFTSSTDKETGVRWLDFYGMYKPYWEEKERDERRSMERSLQSQSWGG